MKCLIIAAGGGTRLKTKGHSKPLVPLLGVPLIERVIVTAQKAGFTDFFVVVGHDKEKVKKHLKLFSRTRNIKIITIDNDEWKKENGISVLKAKDFIKEKFVLLMTDHLFEESILRTLKDQKIANDEVILAVDYNLAENIFVDIDDVTKVDVKNNTIKNIGKKIERYNGYDTGIFLCSPAIFSAIKESSKKGDSSLTGGVKRLITRKKAKSFDIKNSFWIDVDDEQTFNKAESKLIDDLKKPNDGPVSRYLNRPISTRISKYLTKTKISPNLISLVSFTISMWGVFFFFLGGYSNLVIGAILAQISSIVDGIDGEIARLKFQGSDFGGWFDAVLDRYADAFLLFGLTYYIFVPSGNIIFLFVGFLAMIGSFMNSYTADKYDNLMKKKLVKKNYFRMGRDVRVFIIFLGAVINQVFFILIVIAILMNLENVRRVIVLKRSP